MKSTRLQETTIQKRFHGGSAFIYLLDFFLSKVESPYQCTYGYCYPRAKLYSTTLNPTLVVEGSHSKRGEPTSLKFNVHPDRNLLPDQK